jgi:hypothetical protein
VIREFWQLSSARSTKSARATRNLQLMSISNRLFTELDIGRVDEFGFLDHTLTPRVWKFDRVLKEPLAWVQGPPWLGKSTVAIAVDSWLRLNSDAAGGIGDRHALTRLGSPGVERDIPPVWWPRWCQDTPRPAVWLIDGVDEECGGGNAGRRNT